MSRNAPLRLPALDPSTLPELRSTLYPEPLKRRVAGRVKKKLGDACGLTQYGVNLVTLEPGSESALRHWHTHEEEFVYVLEGEVMLITNAGEQTLRAGDCAGYPAGTADGHHLVNRSGKPARYLEIGTRNDDDVSTYPDDDLQWLHGEVDGKQSLIPAHKNGNRY
ncbi:MAG TPA: cupin domain-containing protein [Nevskiaceae bacterium]|nr:cupin domain-containing protein [Nevskiaceae bacterium]